jgi:hypothetical protein
MYPAGSPELIDRVRSIRDRAALRDVTATGTNHSKRERNPTERSRSDETAVTFQSVRHRRGRCM